ncbi:hypothetical protein AVEN_107-1 [Araneus ventricosus]|uniref:Uncharacterized protein n=1 Tax=Araneus ventricosus TaxID=182803 RepID=A0A4Y2D403_ARAVE|nr:hypothetical protein AVEN_107-1 [Araneus ventricosus]
MTSIFDGRFLATRKRSDVAFRANKTGFKDREACLLSQAGEIYGSEIRPLDADSNSEKKSAGMGCDHQRMKLSDQRLLQKQILLLPVLNYYRRNKWGYIFPI